MGRQPTSVLKKADEIKVLSEDYKKIPDYAENLADKTIILEWGKVNDAAIEIFNLYDRMFENFYIALKDLKSVKKLNDAGIKWYWDFPITSYYELNTILADGPAYVLLGAPLTFDIDKVSKIVKDVQIRIVPNLAKPEYLSNSKNWEATILSSWIRPEDIDLYADASVCEFYVPDMSLTKETALFDIYKDKKVWNGNLNLLFTNFGFDIDNKNLNITDIGRMRYYCGQKCLSGYPCHVCHQAFLLAKKIHDEGYFVKPEQES
jgi:hypothetical protein